MEIKLKEFARTLKTLTSNDKYVINTLSVMAMKAKSDPVMSKEISKLAMGNIFNAPVQQKLFSFYVVDSIIKNVGSPYKEMFSEKVVDAFIHTFQANKDPSIRIKLYNLRVTWKQHFSPELMNHLDEEVRKLDPAWPLVVKFIPKSSKLSDAKKSSDSVNDDCNSAKSSPDSTTPTVSRDPRIQKIVKIESPFGDRKRKSCEDEQLFMIDTKGDEHIKKRIKEKPRIDLKPAVVNDEPFQNGITIGKQDIDLRIPLSSEQKEPPVKKVLEAVKQQQQMLNRNWTSEDVFRILIKKENITGNFKDDAAVVRVSTATAQQPTSRIPNQSPLPQPREPIWRILIDGFPQFPQIGTDPRLLVRCPFYDPFRTITIDGHKYLLYLDRIQPCIFVNNELHAVRFYCQTLDVHINNVIYNLAINGLTHIKINRRFYVACLGGPGHELVINGWPYNVRIDGNMHQITVSGCAVSVQFVIRRPIQVNLQNAIPPYICEWAVKGFFGAPQYLNMPPLNPLKHQKCQDAQAYQFRNELSVYYGRRLFNSQPMCQNPVAGNNEQQPVVQSNTKLPPNATTTVALPLAADNSSIASSCNSRIDVHDLFQKLVATGIIHEHRMAQEHKFDITKYSWDQFKLFNDKEVGDLYSGHQCDLCGTRFKNKDSKEFELHLDYHFIKNTTSLTTTRSSRNYVSGSRQWVIGGVLRTGEPDFNFEQTTNLEQKFKCPMFEDVNLNKCEVCMEKFEVVWDEEEESFMLLDGQLHNGKVYHPICLEDADKQIDNPDQSDDADKSQIELTDQPIEALQKVLQGKIESVVLPETNFSESESRSDHSENDFNYESATVIKNENNEEGI